MSRSRAPFDKCVVVASSIAAIQVCQHAPQSASHLCLAAQNHSEYSSLYFQIVSPQDCHATSQQLSCVLIGTGAHARAFFTHTFALASAAELHAALAVVGSSSADDEEQRLVLDTAHVQRVGPPDSARFFSHAECEQIRSAASAAEWLPAVGAAVRCVFAEDQRFYPATVLAVESAAPSDQRESALRVRVVYDAPWGNEDSVALNKTTRAEHAIA